jgi:hypothetical protein
LALIPEKVKDPNLLPSYACCQEFTNSLLVAMKTIESKRVHQENCIITENQLLVFMENCFEIAASNPIIK